MLRAQLTRVGLYMLREVLLNGVAVPLTSAASAPLVVVPGAVGNSAAVNRFTWSCSVPAILPQLYQRRTAPQRSL